MYWLCGLFGKYIYGAEEDANLIGYSVIMLMLYYNYFDEVEMGTVYPVLLLCTFFTLIVTVSALFLSLYFLFLLSYLYMRVFQFVGLATSLLFCVVIYYNLPYLLPIISYWTFVAL